MSGAVPSAIHSKCTHGCWDPPQPCVSTLQCQPPAPPRCHHPPCKHPWVPRPPPSATATHPWVPGPPQVPPPPTLRAPMGARTHTTPPPVPLPLAPGHPRVPWPTPKCHRPPPMGVGDPPRASAVHSQRTRGCWERSSDTFTPPRPRAPMCSWHPPLGVRTPPSAVSSIPRAPMGAGTPPKHHRHPPCKHPWVPGPPPQCLCYQLHEHPWVLGPPPPSITTAHPRSTHGCWQPRVHTPPPLRGPGTRPRAKPGGGGAQHPDPPTPPPPRTPTHPRAKVCVWGGGTGHPPSTLPTPSLGPTPPPGTQCPSPTPTLGCVGGGVARGCQ